MMTLKGQHKAIAAACLALCGTAWAQSFTPGNLVAYRVGTGTGALPVYLDEYRADGTLVQTLALSGGATPLTASSTASEGLLNRSANGQCLTVPGYAVAPGGSDPKAGAARGVAFVGWDAAVNNQTRLGGSALVGDAMRGAISDNCARVWASGAGSPNANRGIWFVARDGASAVQLSNKNTQGITIADGQLYAAFAGGDTVNKVGTGLPTAPTPAVSALPGLSANNMRGIAFLDLDGTPGVDTLYVAANNDGNGTLQKYAYDGSTWVAKGSVPLSGVHGLSALPMGDGGVMLLATAGNNQIQRLFDTAGRTGNLTGTPQTMATAGEGVFYGLAWAPEATPPASLPATPTGVTAQAAGNSVNAQWNAAVGADYYLLEVSADDFAHISQSLIVFGTSQTVNGLAEGSYKLRVRAVNSLGGGTAAASAAVNTSAPPTTSLPAITALSGVLGDASDALATTGLAFTVNDPAATVSATSGNTAVVAANGLAASNVQGNALLRITPTGVGYADITVTLTNAGGASITRTIKYAASANPAPGTSPRWLAGRSDASTAIVVDAATLLVGDDEAPAQDASGNALPGGNSFSAYGPAGGLPVKALALDKTALGLGDPNACTQPGITGLDSCKSDEEMDIEASFSLGSRVYGTGSHSNNKNGKSRTDRWRLFAFDVAGSGATTTLTPQGDYRWLREDLRSWDAVARDGRVANYFGLVASSDGGPTKAPESETRSGFSIEGMSTSPDDSAAWLGFRAPLVSAPGGPAVTADNAANRTHALILPVNNFTALPTANGGSPGQAQIGQPIRLNLGERGIREIRKNAAGQYLIIAGPSTSATGVAPRNFQLYSWDGRVSGTGEALNLRPRGDALAAITVPNTACSAEGIGTMPAQLDAGGSVDIISDCGDADFYGDGQAAKDLPYAAWKKARLDSLPIPALSTVVLATQTVDQTSATVTATPSQSGTLRAVALPVSAPTPSWEQVMAGLDASGQPAPASNLVQALAGTPAGLSFTGLDPQLAYRVHAINLPATGTASAPVALSLVKPQPIGTQIGSGSNTAGVSNGAGNVGADQWQFASNSEGFGTAPATGSLPANLRLPYGALSFVLVGGTPGSTATLRMDLPEAAPAQATLWKYGPTTGTPTAHWYALDASAYRFAADRRSVSFDITDGQTGDSDLAVNGVIVDPVALAAPAAVPPVATATPVPGLSALGQALLALGLAGAAALRRRRR
ncbi:MAG: IPTL-CTERM sorting domain-containing protein [Burkholderiaceae bacterium]|nr:IPTL-CTERM sorting domain-containing protein [Burkholderiaceae bacterium]